ncbi:MAG: ABC transporter ATP-binding protein [Erysipelotrichales bacterium]|nr:ABC transporter ATP-binding protein [Erysipelotrichales bacterium]
MEKIIEVKNLCKSYGKIKAVDDISFYVEKGKLFAFLGPNGAGKSTTIDTICTFLKADSGQVLVNNLEIGKDDNDIRKIIGAVFQDGLLDDLLTIEENLKFRGSLYGLRGKTLNLAVKKAMQEVNVVDLAKRQYGKLSGGQKRRCDIARALINTPRILFLDEPTTGLDPQTRKVVWETIIKLQKENNMTIFLTTHYMEEANSADYVIVIDNGKIAAKGTPIELKEQFANDKLIISSNDMQSIKEVLIENKIVFSESAANIIIKLEKTTDSLPIIQLCKKYITAFEVIAGTLDDAFIGITGKEIRE